MYTASRDREWGHDAFAQGMLGVNKGNSVTSRAGTLLRLSLPWRGFGALVLGVLLARWSWILFAPHATATAVVPEHASAVETGRLFGSAASGVSQAGGMALPNVRLTGVFAGKPGFAVLKLDGKQQVGVAVGENVVPGTKLLEVHPDYVLLERAGVQQRVNLEEKAAGAIGASVAPAVR